MTNANFNLNGNLGYFYTATVEPLLASRLPSLDHGVRNRRGSLTEAAKGNGMQAENSITLVIIEIVGGANTTETIASVSIALSM